MKRMHIGVLLIVLAGCGLGVGNAFAAASAQMLMDLVKSGSIDRLQAYLSQPGVDINARPDNDKALLDKALLDYAAEQNQLQVATYLIDHGARVDAQQTMFMFSSGWPPGTTALHRAAAFDAAEVAELLIARGADVNANISPDRAFGTTPLLFAALNGSRRTVEILLKHGADVSVGTPAGQTPISESLSHGHLEIAQLLLAHGAKIDTHSLSGAAANGQVESVRFILARGIDAAAKDRALRSAVQRGEDHPAEHKQIIKLLLASGADINNRADKAPNTPLMMASSPDLVEFLIANGADPSLETPRGTAAQALACNQSAKDPIGIFKVLVSHKVDIASAPKTEMSVLRCAALFNRPDFAEFLLAHGVPVDVTDGSGRTAFFEARDRSMVVVLMNHGANINAINKAKQTPLSVAVTEGRAQLAQLLLSLGADIHSGVKPGQSLLHIAAESGQRDLVAALLEHGADVNQRDMSGDTALHLAIKSDHDEVAALLLAHGADVNARGRDGWTPLHEAASRNNRSMVALLLDRGADWTLRDNDHLPPQRRATSTDVRELFARRSGVADPGRFTTGDISACTEIVQRAREGELEHGTADINASDNPPGQDPGDDWDYLNQVTGQEDPIVIEGRHYFLGVGAESGYLARMGSDGVEDVLCEFAIDSQVHPPVYRLLNEFERLKARSQRDFVSLSLESLKHSGVAGAQALLLESRRKVNPVPLSFDSDDNILGDAIEAHRDDVLKFYLDHGVDPNLKWVDHRPVDGVHSLPWHDQPLFTAVRYGTSASLLLLLDHGANPDSTGDDVLHQTALAWAVLNGRVPLVQMLLDHGATPNFWPASFAVHRTLDAIFENQPVADDNTAAIHSLLLHGANPNPWIFTAFQTVARDKNRGDLLGKSLASADGFVRAEWIESSFASPGPLDRRIELMLKEAIAVRDSTGCLEEMSSEALRICLPNALRRADADLNARYVALTASDIDPAGPVRIAQSDWLKERDRQCGLRTVAALTKAGWLSYLLADQSKAICVLRVTRQRINELTNFVNSVQ